MENIEKYLTIDYWKGICYELSLKQTLFVFLSTLVCFWGLGAIGLPEVWSAMIALVVDFGIFRCIIKSKKGADFNWRKFAALVFMLVAVSIACQTYYLPYRTGLLGRFKDWFSYDVFGRSRELTLEPDLETTLISSVLYISLYVRGYFILDKFVDYLMMVLNMFFISSILKAIIGTEDVFFGLSGLEFVIIATAFSYFGIKSIAGFVWVFVIIVATFNLGDYSKAMGVTGAFYLIFAWLSIILQFGNEEFKALLKCIGQDIKITGSRLREDVKESSQSVMNVMAKVKPTLNEGKE